MATGFITSPRFQDHITGPDHPESPARLRAVINRLDSAEIKERLRFFSPKPANRHHLELVHIPEYISRFETACINGDQYVDTLDNPICPETFSVALLAAGAAIRGTKLIFSEIIRNAMVLLRPPGHHAEKDRAMGFCFFNNAALAARTALEFNQVEKVAIIDFDVHHGNGTQHIFYTDPSVLYVSIHRFPFYPGTGDKDETGSDKGSGYTENYPLPAGAGDKIFLDVVDSIAEKVIVYNPDYIILSAGFDAHVLDPLGGMQVTTDGFKKITRRFKQLADETCDGKLLSLLEGGYSLEGLSDSILVHLEELLEE